MTEAKLRAQYQDLCRALNRINRVKSNSKKPRRKLWAYSNRT